MLNSARRGFGIVELPDDSNILNSGLVDIFPDCSGPETPMYCIFPERRKGSKKINTLVQYLCEKKKYPPPLQANARAYQGYRSKYLIILFLSREFTSLQNIRACSQMLHPSFSICHNIHSSSLFCHQVCGVKNTKKVQC